VNFLNKIKDMVGLNEAEEYDEYDEEDDEDYSNYQQPIAHDDHQHNRRNNRNNMASHSANENRGHKNNVIGMPGLNNNITEVVVFEPHSFDEMPQVIEALRQRRSAVLNLNIMDAEEAQRAVDFVAGGTYAIDGHQERIGESIFLFTPSCVQVTTPSGVVHEANQVYPTSTKPSTPTPAWSAQSNRIAQ
jgi:cell division inhibitor SepF